MIEDSGFQVRQDGARLYHELVEPFMAPFVGALVAVGVEWGQRVLDIACGTGLATRASVSAVGPSGSVVGVDVNPKMIAAARTMPGDNEGTVEWRTASALDLPFADGEFDAAICQQGMQFFPDPAGGLREVARTVSDGGRISATVWAAPELNPFFRAETDMLVEFCGYDRGESVGAYATGGGDQVVAWFEAAGLRAITIDAIEAVASLPPVVEYVPRHLRVTPWSVGFFDLDPETQREAIEYVERSLADHRSESGIDVPFRSYLTTATV